MIIFHEVYFASDVNAHACLATTQTALLNNCLINTIQSDFGTGFLPRLYHQIDILLFNFPYVPTPTEEVFDPQHYESNRNAAGLQASWAGGVDGREVIDRWISEQWLERLLSRHGICYVVLVEENDISDTRRMVCQKMMDSVAFREGNEGCKEKMEWCSAIVSQQNKRGKERLYVVKFWRQ